MSDPNNENLLVKQQKYRAQRIDHDYHKKPHPWRSLMRVLTFALPLIAATWLAVVTFSSGKRGIYEPGPVSSHHNSFNEKCELCHEVENGKYGVVTNRLCSTCHDGPVHNANQICPGMKEPVAKNVSIEEPRCASCHTEHKGNQQLVKMADQHCTQCHDDLKVKPDASGKAADARITGFRIKSFEDGHPEWRALTTDKDGKKFVDNTPIKFGHERHMKQAYDKDSKYGPRLMECMDCHKTTESNLEPMPSESARLAEIETTIDKAELEKFYAGVVEHAQSRGVVKYKLNSLDLRKLAVETASDPVIYDRFKKLAEKPSKMVLFEEALLRTIRSRLGSMAAAGENRYMIPITYAKNCASECHKHDLKLLDMPNGTQYMPRHASADMIRAEVAPLIRQQLVDGMVVTVMAKAAPPDKGPFAAIIRNALLVEAKADKEADKEKQKAAMKSKLEELSKKELYGFLLKAFADAKAKKDDLYSFLSITKDNYEAFTELKKAKEKAEWAEPVAKVIVDEVINKEGGGAAADVMVPGKEIATMLGPLSAKNLEAEVLKRTNAALEPLFHKVKTGKDTCIGCHVSKTPEKADIHDGEVLDPNIPVRWLNHAAFNHQTHSAVGCEDCHATARTSKLTEDVLLPSKESCAKCHKPTAARSDCIECHIYHDKTHTTPTTGGTLENTLNGKPKGEKATTSTTSASTTPVTSAEPAAK